MRFVYYETDHALEVCTWLSVFIPHVECCIQAYMIDFSAPSGSKGAGLGVLWPSDDEEMLFRMAWEGRL